MIKTPLSQDAQKIAGEALHGALVDLIDLSLAGKHAHWNVTGPRFRIIHFQLDEVVKSVRKHADVVAERSAAIGIPADGRSATVAAETRLPQPGGGWLRDDDVVAAFVSIYEGIITRMRERARDVEQADPVTTNILQDLTQDLEKQYWMWQAENS